MKSILTTLIGLALFQIGLAERGTIRGTIVDSENGEELIGVNIVIEGTTVGTASDIDGSFSFSVEPGTYSVVFSYISYTNKTVSEVKVKSGVVTNLDIITLEAEGTGLDEVVVTARALKNTDASLLNVQKKSANVIDGISAQTFSKTGDGDAAAAIKRVTGVTVEDGKYVYVRGLGDRYSKSVLNGLEIPGLDPEKNSVQMDIFPTNVIDNIIVYKSFTPDLPGDFTGGMVDVTTKDFPNDLTINVSASYGVNTITHFRNDFILYEGDKLDAMAFGAKSRSLPFHISFEPNTRYPETIFNYTNALNKEIGAKKMNNFLDQSYAFSIGNQLNRDKVTHGYLVALNYKNGFTFKPDFYQSSLRIQPNVTSEGHVTDFQNEINGKTGIQESLWSTMFSYSAKFKRSKIGAKYLHTQASEKSASERIKDDYFNTNRILQTSLDYMQRMVSNTIVSGEHLVKDRLKLSWSNALTRNTLANPDQTNSDFVLLEDKVSFQSGDANLDKVTRQLMEWNNNGKVDLQLDFKQWNSLDAKFKVGAAHLFKKRDFQTYTVSIGRRSNTSDAIYDIDGDLNSILQSSNLFSSSSPEGYMINGVQIDKENKFTSEMQITASYIMTELPLHAKVKFIGGLRTEYAVMNYMGAEQLTGAPIDKEVLNSFQFLPSANFVFNVTDKLNIRSSYSQTVARPSFKEKSEAIIVDPVSATTFYGNLNLKESHIHNADLRFEYFLGGSEIVALSGFYKKFLNPIEIQPIENGGPNHIKPVNRPEADVIGVELEFRKNMGFISEALRPLSLTANFTYVRSLIDLTEEQSEKYSLIGQSIPEKRDLLGQSPFVINLGMNYSNNNSGTEVNLSYNLKGKTLVLAGIGTIPDVYEDPYHGLDFKFSQKVGKSDQFKLSASVQNLVGDNFNQYYEYLGEEIETFRSYSRGRQVSLGFIYDIK